MLLPTFEPYKLLGAVLLLISAAAGGAYLGYQYCDGQHARAAAEAKDAALEGARVQAEADKRAAIDRVRRETLAAAKAQLAKDRGMRDANLKANPECSRDAESVSLLVDAINVANGTGTDAGSLPKALPNTGGSRGWFR